jgi:peptidoglycan/xylan/chitin deacetylase (PgdA/CDA1 family)
MKKLKAVTFSYDDGVTQDIRLIELFDKYGLKCTFNLNSAFLGGVGSLVREGVNVSHNKVRPEQVRQIYKNHEVAVHTLHHPRLPSLPDEEVIREVEEDRQNLSRLVGYEVVGMAYPCGGVNNDDRVAEVIKNHTGVRYSRTITSSHSFEPQDNLFRFNPTVYHHVEFDLAFRLAREFIELKTDTPKIFYIWGHAYELDIHNTWDKMEELCKLISGRDDIFYGTNKEVLLSTDWE